MMNYHFIWLENHPNRTKEWLQERLTDGFDIHHADGNHANDDPNNLVLIECNDHMRLHGLSLDRLLSAGKAARSEEREAHQERVRDIRKACYEKKDARTPWSAIGREFKPDSLQPAPWARSMAMRHADENGLPFPKPDSNVPLGVFERRSRVPTE